VSRYFPGGFVTLGTRVYLSSEIGFKAADVTTTSILEVLFQVVALALIIILFLGGEAEFFRASKGLFLLISFAVFLMFVFIFPIICNFIDNILKKFFGFNTLISAFKFSRTEVAFYLTGYIFTSLIVGVSYYLILYSIYESVQLSIMWYVVGVISLSSIVSIFSIFAPGGLGVREGIIIIFLVQVVPEEIAISLAILSRFLGIFLDIIFFFIVKIGMQYLKHR
jgi:uncharacterized membrane protein YbhN (UPF0104 family)